MKTEARAREDHEGPRIGAGEARGELVAQPRLADAGRADHHRRPRDGLGGALGVDGLEVRELAVAAHAGRRLAHEQAHRHGLGAGAGDHAALRAILHQEALADEPRRRLVGAHGEADGVALDLGRAPLEQVAREACGARERAPGDDGEAQGGQARGGGEPGADGAHRLVPQGPVAAEDRYQPPPEGRVAHRPLRLRDGREHHEIAILGSERRVGEERRDDALLNRRRDREGHARGGRLRDHRRRLRGSRGLPRRHRRERVGDLAHAGEAIPRVAAHRPAHERVERGGRARDDVAEVRRDPGARSSRARRSSRPR